MDLFARLSQPHFKLLSLLTVVAALGLSPTAHSQAGALVPIRPGQIDEAQLTVLKGNTHPLARPQFDQGLAPDSLPLEHMYLLLQRTPAQENAASDLLGQLQNPHSSTYHHWLTADQVGQQFGPPKSSIETVTYWLGSHGIQVNGVSKSGMVIDVSATAGQVRQTFHTEMHKYLINGTEHIANASDPKIPTALASIVTGFNSLSTFKPKPLLKRAQKGFSFNFPGYGEQYDVSPADFATIYNVTPLYKGKTPITGKGQTVVVLEETDINPADVATFRSAFGLSSYSGTFTQIHPGPGCGNPGKNAAEGEAALDAEWAGAIAPDAKVELASCADTSTNFGPFIAAQNLLDSAAPPPIMSLSYLGCEADQGPGGNAYVGMLWEQAALEGVSVFVASGDNGAAGCDDFDLYPTWATGGIQANGLASTPFNTATGGTDFLDTAENQISTYWSTSNTATGKSVKSYVPEMPWDESCANSVLAAYWGYPSGYALCNSQLGQNWLDVVAGSGAPSFVWSKPYWQKGVYGNPNDGVRDLPDVSLFASSGFWNHAILFCMSDPKEGGVPCNYSNPTDALYNSAGGTSFTAPQFASIQALINQKALGPQGNPAPIYYDLGKAQYGTTSASNKTGLSSCKSSATAAQSKACLFHDVTVGDIDVVCYGTNNCYGGTGLNYGVLSTSNTQLKVAYPALPGWDFATGLGTLNVTNVVDAWP